MHTHNLWGYEPYARGWKAILSNTSTNVILHALTNMLQACLRQLPLPLEDTDLPVIHDQPSILVFHSPLVSAMGGVILKHVHLWETEWLLVLGGGSVGKWAFLKSPCFDAGSTL